MFLCSFVKFCFNKNVCYYYLNCFICFGALFMAHPVLCSTSCYKSLNQQVASFVVQFSLGLCITEKTFKSKLFLVAVATTKALCVVRCSVVKIAGIS